MSAPAGPTFFADAEPVDVGAMWAAYLGRAALAASPPPERTILSLDFETYSEVNLRDAGASVYARHPSTEVLMLAYATSKSEIKQWVPAHGEPMPDDLRRALADPGVTIAAWNAPFEMAITEHVLGVRVPRERWLDVMALSYSLALPGGLDKAGEVIGLGEDKKKLARGKTLIRKFCQPRKPTKNKPWTRSTRETDPEEWQEFLEYNRQDVEAERSIYRRIKKWQMPDAEWAMWHLDQKINDAGIPINLNAVKAAVRLAQATTKKDLDEMKALTGLANPNSGAQLLPWLRERGYIYGDLKKGHVARAAEWVEGLADEADLLDMLGVHKSLLRVLRLRLRISKASVKKYPALVKATDEDWKLRGCHQFAGASRTWRWCLPAHTPVLVYRPGTGQVEVRITDVRLSDLVWDGCEWVRHEGVVYSGVRETMSFDGVTATPSHRVYVNSWFQVPLAVAKRLQMEVWRGSKPLCDLSADFAQRAQLRRPDQDRFEGEVEDPPHEGPDDGQAPPAPRLDQETRPGGFRDGGPRERPVERRGESCGSSLDRRPIPRVESIAGRGGRRVRACLFLAADAERPIRVGGVPGEALCNPEAADGRKPEVVRGVCRGRASLARSQSTQGVSPCSPRAPGGNARERCSARALGSARPPVREIWRPAIHRLREGQEGARELPQTACRSGTVAGEGSVGPKCRDLRQRQNALERDVGRSAAESPSDNGESPSGGESEVRRRPGALGGGQGASPGGDTPVLGGETRGEGEPTFDIINAGPRKRFTAWGRVVSNSGRRFQPQNLSKPSKAMEKFIVGMAPTHDGYDELSGAERAKIGFGILVHDIEHLSVEEFWAKYEDPDNPEINTMEALVAAVRPMVQAPPGHLLVDADLAAIENVVLGWLAQDDKILRVFREGLDPYIDFATDMFGMSYDAIAAEVAAGDKSKRTTAKPGVLGCGYLLGPGQVYENSQTGELEATGLLGYAWGMGVDLTPEMSKLSVDTFRSKFEKVKNFWYDLERAAIRTVRTKKPHTVGYLTFDISGPFLRIRLPSGRYLSYFRPQVRERMMPWGKTKLQLSYEQIDNGQWKRVSTHPGKITENCFAEDTPIRTLRGAVRISALRPDDLVWDGEDFVRHGGVVQSGVQKTIDYGGVRVTPDHRIWSGEGWRHAGSYEHDKATSAYARHFGTPFGRARRFVVGWKRRAELVLERALRLRVGVSSGRLGVRQGQAEVVRVPEARPDLGGSEGARNVGPSSVRRLAQHDRPLHAADTPGLAQLRRARDHGLRPLASLLRELLGGHGADLRARAVNRAHGQREGLSPRELPVGDPWGAGGQPEDQPSCPNPPRGDDAIGAFEGVRDRRDDSVLPTGSGPFRRRSADTPGPAEPVYDILNCGPRSRFVVAAPAGDFVAHNCVQAVARDLLAHGMTLADRRGLDLRLHVHDQAVAVSPEDRADRDLETLIECLTTRPWWADDTLPLRAAGFTTPIFIKD